MKVIILRGISGSGKTTLAANLELVCGEESLTISADDFWEMGHEYKFDVTKIGEAHAHCLLIFMQQLKKWSHPAIKHDPLLIVDNTNTRAIEAAPYYTLAEAHGGTVRIVTIICDPQLAWESNNHGTSPKILWAQHQRILIEQLPSWWKQEVAFRYMKAAGYEDGGELHYEDGMVFDSTKLLEEMNEA